MKAEDVVIGEKYVVTGGGEYPVCTVVTVVRPSLHKDVPELFAVTKQELYIPDKKILDYEDDEWELVYAEHLSPYIKQKEETQMNTEYVFDNTEMKPWCELTKEEQKLLVCAYIDGVFIEYVDDGLCFRKTNSHFWDNHVYRIKPKEHKKLDIPWQFIKPEYKWAVMDEDENVFLFEDEPTIGDTYWHNEDGRGDVSNTKCLVLDTTGIQWQHSLTQRPDNI